MIAQGLSVLAPLVLLLHPSGSRADIIEALAGLTWRPSALTVT
jgi:hypothetical protein